MDLRLIIEPSIGLGNVQEEGKGLPFVVAFCLSEEMGIDSSLCWFCSSFFILWGASSYLLFLLNSWSYFYTIPRKSCFLFFFCPFTQSPYILDAQVESCGLFSLFTKSFVAVTYLHCNLCALSYVSIKTQYKEIHPMKHSINTVISATYNEPLTPFYLFLTWIEMWPHFK